MKSILAAAAVVGTVHAASVEFESAFEELKGCHVAMGVCLSNLTGYIGIDEASCSETLVRDSLVEDDMLQIVTWYQAYATADELEADANSITNTTYLARLAEGTTVADYKTALTAADALFADFVFCESSTWSVVTGDVDSVAEIGFKFPLTDKLRLSPSEYEFEGESALATGEHVVRVLSTASASRGTDFVADMQARAQVAVGSGVVVSRVNGVSANGVETVLVKQSGAAQRDAVLAWIASEPNVIWVEPKPRYFATNLDAAAITQSGTEFMTETIEGSMPFWDAGLLGQGQVVGVGDSGLDTSSCYFRDASVDEEANKLARAALGSNVIYINDTVPAEFDLTVDTRTDYPGHRKVVQYVGFADGVENATSGHGTHVAGTVAGNLGPSNLNATAGVTASSPSRFPASDFKGMAPEAKIAFFDMGIYDVARFIYPPPDYKLMYQPAYEVGARIHTNSWGSAAQFYDAEMASGDEFVFENQDFLPLFAAGNSGRSGTLTAGTPSVGKNLMCVGATNNAERSYKFIRDNFNVPDTFSCPIKVEGETCGDSMADFSSNGPTWDGRIKPDVSAPGFYIFSARSGAYNEVTGQVGETCEASPKAGTSMATPVTAGNAALVRQFFADGYYPSGAATAEDAFEPMGALVKAVLVNGADLMPGLNWNNEALSLESPDVFQGFGRINLGNNLRLNGNTELSETIVDGNFGNMPTFTASGDVKEYTIEVPAAAEGGLLKATLVWFEPASSVTATLVRVNDLDITIKKPDGTVVFANGLTTYDRVNQVEQVQITNPEAGTYTVTVEAHAIRMNDVAQPFAVVISTNMQETAAPTRSPTSSKPTTSPTTPEPTAVPTTSPIIAVTEEPANQNLTLWLSIIGGTIVSIGMLYCGIVYFKPSDEYLQENADTLAVGGKKHPGENL